VHARFPPASYLNVVTKVATASDGDALLGYANFATRADNFDDGVVVRPPPPLTHTLSFSCERALA
jgi:hypothetical protein